MGAESNAYALDSTFLDCRLRYSYVLLRTIIVDLKAGYVRNQSENVIVLPKWSGGPKDEHKTDLVGHLQLHSISYNG